MGLIWAPTLGVVWQRHRELETQLSGPANPGVDFRTNHNYISMNNGDSASAHSDAMDKHVRGGSLTSRAGTDDHGTDDQAQNFFFWRRARKGAGHHREDVCPQRHASSV